MQAAAELAELNPAAHAATRARARGTAFEAIRAAIESELTLEALSRGSRVGQARLRSAGPLTRMTFASCPQIPRPPSLRRSIQIRHQVMWEMPSWPWLTRRWDRPIRPRVKEF